MTGTRLLLALIAGLLLSSAPALAAGQSYDAWLAHFKHSARQQGITDATLDMAFTGVRPSERVIELDGKQPEHKIGFDEYYKRTLTEDRIAKGRRLLRDNWQILSRVEQQYGVQAQFIVALWGIETSFGQNTGGFDLIQALASLAWDGRRGEYFESELIKALKILQGNHVARRDFKGSWAGAMGQIQFMPSSWFAYAVDYNGDGHKNIWTERPDIFASAANYLSRSGWNAGERWGRQVKLGAVDRRLVNANAKMSLAEWSRLGVRTMDGQILPTETSVRASLISPDGSGGKVYLVYDNFQTIMKWNRSKYFALSVGMLADKIGEARPGTARAEPVVPLNN